MNAVPILVGLGVVVALVAARSASEMRPRPAPAPPTKLCNDPPPSSLAMPGGWAIHSGAISRTASKKASAALDSGLGTLSIFTDEDGAERALFVTWHCHEAPATPTGWHKGVTLLDRAAGGLTT